MDHLLFFLSRLVATLFFIGLAGCIPVVAFSWFSILKNEFFPGDEAREEAHPPLHRHRSTEIAFRGQL